MTLPTTTRRTIELGRTAFGAATLGNLQREMSDETAHEILGTAWDLGIRHFDTAPHYGLGLSERRLGAFLRTRPRDEYVLSTKAGRLLRPNPAGAGTLDLEQGFVVPADLQRVADFSADGVRRSLEESLDRLGLDRVDVLYLHDPERYGLADALATGVPGAAALRDEGLVRAIGVGSMSTPALLDAARTGALDLLMVAGRYTLVEQPVRPEVLDACAEHGVGIVAASVFNSGLLARQDPSGGSGTTTAPSRRTCCAAPRRSPASARSTGPRCPRRPCSTRCATRWCAPSSSAPNSPARSGRIPNAWPSPCPRPCGSSW